jgi:hypothetical protein
MSLQLFVIQLVKVLFFWEDFSSNALVAAFRAGFSVAKLLLQG